MSGTLAAARLWRRHRLAIPPPGGVGRTAPSLPRLAGCLIAVAIVQAIFSTGLRAALIAAVIVILAAFGRDLIRQIKMVAVVFGFASVLSF